MRRTVPVLAIGGPAGSGKSSIADAAGAVLEAPVIRLDDCYHTDPALAPSLPRYDGPGLVVNFSDPDAIVDGTAPVAESAGLIVRHIDG